MNSLRNYRSLFFLGLAFCIAGCDGSSSGVSQNIQRQGPPVVVVDPDGNTSIDSNNLDAALNQIPLGTIEPAEEAGLIFMREEEKLARDVYTHLSTLWTENIFDNIGRSEQTHTEAVLALLERYGIPDPVGANATGVFLDPSLQGLYDMLAARGSASLIDALYVGAEIEEIDIIDLQIRLSEVTENEDIVMVYENLMKGSRNHLRAFVRVMEREFITYDPQHLTREEYDAIINSETETGSGN